MMRYLLRNNSLVQAIPVCAFLLFHSHWPVRIIPSSPSNRWKSGSAGKGCLTALGILAFSLIGGCLYFESRRPHFSGTSPSAIDVRVDDVASTNVYQMSITNRAACETILQDFLQARPVFGASKAIGAFTFHYDSGKTDVVWMIPGMPQGYYTIYLGGTFRMPSERFYQVLKEGGVNVAKIRKD
jgi:hypothetical protein